MYFSSNVITSCWQSIAEAVFQFCPSLIFNFLFSYFLLRYLFLIINVDSSLNLSKEFFLFVNHSHLDHSIMKFPSSKVQWLFSFFLYISRSMLLWKCMNVSFFCTEFSQPFMNSVILINICFTFAFAYSLILLLYFASFIHFYSNKLE